MEGKEEVGRVSHFYPKILVAVVELKLPLSTGDKIQIVGRTTRLNQTVESMQIEHKGIETAEAGQSVGLKVLDKVREGDIVYR